MTEYKLKDKVIFILENNYTAGVISSILARDIIGDDPLYEVYYKDPITGPEVIYLYPSELIPYTKLGGILFL